jgi:hypothetical protein
VKCKALNALVAKIGSLDMPSRARRIQLAERKAMLRSMDDAVQNAPMHIRNRLGKPSLLASKLGEIGEYGWRAYRYSETGQPFDLPKRSKANRNRHSDAVEKARLLAQKYAHIWVKPSAAGIISRLEGMSADTVRRYKRLLAV